MNNFPPLVAQLNGKKQIEECDKYNVATLIAAIKKEHNDIWKK